MMLTRSEQKVCTLDFALKVPAAIDKSSAQVRGRNTGESGSSTRRTPQLSSRADNYRAPQGPGKIAGTSCRDREKTAQRGSLLFQGPQPNHRSKSVVVNVHDISAELLCNLQDKLQGERAPHYQHIGERGVKITLWRLQPGDKVYSDPVNLLRGIEQLTRPLGTRENLIHTRNNQNFVAKCAQLLCRGADNRLGSTLENWGVVWRAEEDSHRDRKELLVMPERPLARLDAESRKRAEGLTIKRSLFLNRGFAEHLIQGTCG